MIMLRVATVAVLLCLAVPVWAANDVNLASPDARVQFRLSLDEKGGLQYSVTFRGKAVIESSALGIRVDGANLGMGVEIGKAEPYRVNETYPWNGVKSTAVDNCNGLKIAMTHRQSRTAYTLEVRAYNDGVAFRHVVPGTGTRVPDEATAFRLPGASVLWWHNLEESYEALYQRKTLALGPYWPATLPPDSCCPTALDTSRSPRAGFAITAAWCCRATEPAACMRDWAMPHPLRGSSGSSDRSSTWSASSSRLPLAARSPRPGGSS
jgi:hypothetical protein